MDKVYMKILDPLTHFVLMTWLLGLIREQRWHGADGMEHLRTVKQPPQAIPTFAETVALLMRVRV